jgi:hypothetical protein
LPALFAALAARLGAIERLSYHLGDWQPSARRLERGATLVKLGGFRFQGANTVDVIGAGSRRVTLLVVPPETPTANAAKIADAAADGHNVERVDSLLAHVAGRNGMPRPRPTAE